MAEIILPPEENEETPQAPELNIDKPTENSKVITIEFEAKKTNKVSTKDTNQQLYTTDTDAWFEFKETSLEGANGTYSVVFRNRHDGSIFQRTGDVVDGVAYYKIPHQEIRHAGAWRGQLVYTLENGNTTAREFGYDVKGHILDGKDVREIVVEDFETLMSQLNSMKDNAELELADLVNTAERNELERQQFYESLVEDINDLQENYQELLDTGVLQTNINEKLEELEEEYAPKLTEVTAQLAQKATKKELNTEKERINNLVAHAGDTDGNSELLDIRIVDGKEFETAGEAVRSISTSESLSNISPKNISEKYQAFSNNLFNPDENLIVEKYINSNGEVANHRGYHMIELKVQPLKTYTFYHYDEDNKLIRLSAQYGIFNVNEELLSTGLSESPVQIPSGGHILRKTISKDKYEMGGVMVVEGYREPQEYKPHTHKVKREWLDFTGAENDIQNLSPENFASEYQVHTANLFSAKDNLIPNYYINSDGEMTRRTSQNIIEIPVIEDQFYGFYSNNEKGELTKLSGQFAVYDSDNNVIDTDLTSSHVKIKKGGVLIRKSITDTKYELGNVMVVQGEESPQEYVEKGVTGLKPDIIDEKLLLEKVNNSVAVPDYWLNYLDEKIKEINQRQARLGADGYTFIQMTDFHLNLNECKSPAILKYLMDRLSIKYTINSGDYSNRVSNDSKEVLIGNLEKVYQMFDKTMKRTLPSVGNHDTVFAEDGVRRSLTKEETYHYYYKPFIALNEQIIFANTGNYFYVDDVNNKIRFISLDCFDTPNDDVNEDGTPVYNRGKTFAYSKNQIDWIYNEALDTPEGYSVVLFSHVTPRNVAGTIIPHGGLLLTNILEAYNTSTVYTGGYENEEDGNFDIPSKTYDFTNSGGDVICYTSGHFHKDRDRVYQGIQMLTMTLDGIDEHQGTPGYDELLIKKAGTITEQTFDIYTIDKKNRHVYITRIGAGEDREFYY